MNGQSEVNGDMSGVQSQAFGMKVPVSSVWTEAYNTSSIITSSGLVRWALVSFETRQIVQVINYVIICGVVSFLGIVSNLINVIVFTKQGFKDTINISLLGLAVADLSCLVTMFWNSICYNPLFANSGLPFVSLDVMYLTGGWPHACFNRVTSFITAYISLERCLCILLPLKVKTILTSRRTKVIIVFIFVLMFIVFSPFYYVNGLDWKFSLSVNRSILSLTFGKNRAEVETPTFYIHSVAMSAISLVVVLVCTILLVLKLNQKTKWRQATVAKETASLKEKKVVKMVTSISGIFIVCFLPATLIFFMMAYEPEFSFTGQYQHIFFVTWSVAFVLETINSSVNILVYFKMSSKFRSVLLQLFCASAH